MSLLSSLQTADANDGEWKIFHYVGHYFFCMAMITWPVHLIFSASQNGKMPPIPRSPENNGSVSKFSFHLAPSLVCLIIFNYCVCQYLAKHLLALLWWHNPHIVKHGFSRAWFFPQMFFRLILQLRRENYFCCPKFQNFSLGS
jgi:hypothetical protein